MSHVVDEPGGMRGPSSKLVIGFGLVLIGIALTLLGAKEVWRTLQLRDASTHVAATVTDSRIYTYKGQTDHELHYRFRVDGDSYSFTDATGQRNLWAAVNVDEWHAAKSGGAVDVVYVPGDPWINRPASSDQQPVYDALAGLLLGAGLLGGGIALVLAWRRGPLASGANP